MSDRTQLTEALAKSDEIRSELDNAGLLILIDALDELTVAARLLLDFPTGEQVEAAAVAYRKAQDRGESRPMRAALEAVRDTMIGDG